jgi:hypothetical protein
VVVVETIEQDMIWGDDKFPVGQTTTMGMFKKEFGNDTVDVPVFAEMVNVPACITELP